MHGQSKAQRIAMNTNYADRGRWEFHYTNDPLVRYLRDRRLHRAVRLLRQHTCVTPADQSVLIVCGGIGGEGVYFQRLGFSAITISDISDQALALCAEWNPGFETLRLDSEDLELADDAFDYVVVQDGLHHLGRPTLGFTEMLRVARVAVVVIEPHHGLAGRLFGTIWERHGNAVNYVFRWNRAILEQVTRSYLLADDAVVVPVRLWDHNLAIGRAVRRVPSATRLAAAKACYAMLKPFNRFGNMMVGVVIKPTGPRRERLIGH